MQHDFHNLSLFGLDLGPWLQRWRAGWRALVWGREAGLRHRLEAPVCLRTADGAERWYAAEQPAAAPSNRAQPHYLAHELPADHVLLCEIKLPLGLEADLDEVMQLEAAANSPFAPDDTCHGWTLRERDGEYLHLTLAISAFSEVMACLHREGLVAEDDQRLPEVWCLDSAQRPVVLRGFGEGERAADYRHRLAWLGGLGSLALLLVFALVLVPGLVRDMQADNMDHHLAQAEIQAAESMQLREQLALDNARAQALQEMLLTQFDHALLLDAISADTPDAVYLEQLNIEDQQIRLRGWAANAAAYMQSLTENPRYAEVVAPSAFRRHGRTQLEQFVLHLRLEGVSP